MTDAKKIEKFDFIQLKSVFYLIMKKMALKVKQRW